MSKRNDDLERFVELMIAAQNTKPEPFFSGKTLNALLIAAIIGICAFIWTGITKTPETFSELKQQNTEIRTILGEMKTQLSSVVLVVQQNQREQADLGQRVSAMETAVKSNGERLDKIEGR